MVTQLECIPCFVRQSLEALKQITDDEDIIKRALRRVLKEASEFDMDQSPPEMAQAIHKIIREESGSPDPYYEIKKRSDECALSLCESVSGKVKAHENPFAAALRFAVAGNILDFALLSSWDNEKIEGSFEKALHCDLDEDEVIKLQKETASAGTVLILGDNAGETVFDRIFIENLGTRAKVYYAVKSSPIINDATESDAQAAGIDKVAEILPNGSDAPGTLLNRCSQKFLDIFKSADVVIAKGQANFETLNEEDRMVYFLTQIKCGVIAERYGMELGHWLVSDTEKLKKTLRGK